MYFFNRFFQLKYFIIFIYIFLFSNLSHSFETEEHQRISDKAFHIALDITGLCEGRPADLQIIEVCMLRSDKENWRPRNDFVVPTYGQIVAGVDDIAIADSVFAGVGENRRYPKNLKDLNASFFGQWQQRKSSALRAAHINDTHFQGLVMFGAFDYQQRALQLSQNGQLFGALIAASIGNHYLEDHFAPGHIATPRYNLPDAYALSLHDFYNSVGANYKIANWEVFRSVWKKINESDSRYGFSEDIVVGLDKNYENLLVLHGDGALDQNPTQELYITIVVARALVEVMECYLKQTCKSLFSDYRWRTGEVTRTGRGIAITEPRAGTAAGEYRNFGWPIGGIETGAFPVFALSAGNETLFTDETVTGTSIALDTLLGGTPGSPDYLRSSDGTGKPESAPFNIGLIGGYIWSRREAEFVHGPQIRIAYSVPQINMQLAPYYKYSIHSREGISAYSSNYGVRADLGFSLLTAHLQFGIDHALRDDGKLEKGTALGFGITFALPTSRIVGLRNLSDWSARRVGFPNEIHQVERN